MFSINKNEQETIGNLQALIEKIANESITARGKFFIGFSGKNSKSLFKSYAIKLSLTFKVVRSENICVSVCPRSTLTGLSGPCFSVTSDTFPKMMPNQRLGLLKLCTIFAVS